MFVAFACLLVGAQGAMLRAKTAQEPDTACGKGYDSLVPGTKSYYETASIKLWAHPYHTADNATFGTEFKCWFAYMTTTKCGGMTPVDGRKGKLADLCLADTTEWIPVWKLFTKEEVLWFKDSFPSTEAPGESEDEEGAINYKEAMETAMELNKKETLCLTLYTIDDECVKYPAIRLK